MLRVAVAGNELIDVGLMLLAVNGCQRYGTLRAQLQRCLIGTTTKLGGGLPADHASAKEPFVTLFDMLGIRVSDGIFRDSLLRALRLHDRNVREANQNEGWPQERRKNTAGWHEETHLPVWEGRPDEAMQKRCGA